jgi:hypothetical protein
MVQNVEITFDMEVSSSESSESGVDAEASTTVGASAGWGPFSASVSVSGKVSTYANNARKSDNSAKYHVEVQATQGGTPEGLSRVLDIIAAAVAPSAVESPQAKQDKKIIKLLQPKIDKMKALNKQIEPKTRELAYLKKERDVYKAQDEEAQSVAIQQKNYSEEEIGKQIDSKIAE